jgi:TPR repeat protein
MRQLGKIHKGIHVGTFVSGPGAAAAANAGAAAPGPRKWLEDLKKRAEAGDAIAQNDLGTVYAFGGPGVRPDFAAAVKWLRPLADRGVSTAQTNLGSLLIRRPDAGAAERAEGIALLQKAVAAGEIQAMCHLGHAYRDGIGVERDAEQSEALYRQAADKGNMDGVAGLALAYMESGDEEKRKAAFELNRKAAASGHLLALFELGRSYLDGVCGAPKDEAEAVASFTRAAEAGFAPAMRFLGILCEAGQGLAKDFTAARRWYERSAEAGDAHGVWRLARMVFYGIGTEQNIVKGVDLFRKAAALGDTEAQLAVAAAAECGLGMAHNAAFALAAYRKVAEEAGAPHAMFTLGMVYENGLLGVAPDRAEADRWFRLAAEKGHPGAEVALRTPHRPLIFRPEKWMLHSKTWLVNARLADPPAMRTIGVWFAGGSELKDMEASAEEAARWLTAAAQRGDVDAMAYLPRCLKTAQGITDGDWQGLFNTLLPFAEKGDAGAQNALADLYSFSWRGQPSRTPILEIVKWRRLAAEQTGDAAVENKLGLEYFNLGLKGRFCPSIDTNVSDVTSIGGMLCRNLKAEMTYKLGGWLFRKTRQAYFRESLVWHRKAADKKFANAFTNLGDLYFNGQGIGRDEREAFRMYSEAAKLGDLTGKIGAGVMLCKGWGCEQDEARGMALLQEARRAGSAYAELACTTLTGNMLAGTDADGVPADVLPVYRRVRGEMPCYPAQRMTAGMLGGGVASVVTPVLKLAGCIALIWLAAKVLRQLWPILKLGLGFVD